MADYQRIGGFRSVAQFADYLHGLAPDFPIDDQVLSAAQGSPLAAPLAIGGFTVGNRWCIHPMEGWDGTEDGRPSEHT
ncbi:MAG: NADH:flavin oxidoreductase, partial [Thermoguttaceae bacterium]|nr:NADH:flavin oxidoreductase [Thermoguttaceae bacterium]